MVLMESVKQAHIACEGLSGCGFFLRDIWMMRGAALLQSRPIKIAPHSVDTALLISAIILASQWGWAALTMPWLLVKIVALFVYIVLGAVALRRGKTKAIRIAAWLASLGVFA